MLKLDIICGLVCCSFLLLCRGQVSYGQASKLSNLTALLKRCNEAATHPQCLTALTACDAADRELATIKEGAERDKLREQELDGRRGCEETLGRFAQAELHGRELLKLRISLYGRESAPVAQSLHGMGTVLIGLGRYSEAEELSRQALGLRRKQLGNVHTQVADSLGNLAAALYYQGKYTEAEPLLQEVLEQMRRLHGEVHIDVARSLNNLANILEIQGKLADAESLYRRALALFHKLVGDAHQDVATCMTALGLVLQHRGNYAEAEKMQRQALKVGLKIYGKVHPQVAIILNNLALTLHEQGRYSEAESTHRQALDMNRQVYGDEHPQVARSLANLAGTLVAQGLYLDAETLYLKSLALRRKLLGDDNPVTIITLNQLGLLRLIQGQYAEAEQLFRQGLELGRKRLGDTHPDVMTSLNNLAVILDTQGRSAESEVLHRQVLELRRKQFGDTHPLVALSLHNLACALAAQHRYADAEVVHRQALELRQKILKDTDPQIAESQSNLAMVLDRQGKHMEAETLSRQAVELYRKSQNRKEIALATALNNLAIGLGNQGRYSESRKIQEQSIGLYQNYLGANHPFVAQGLTNLAVLAIAQGFPDQAVLSFRQAAAIREEQLRTVTSESRMRALLEPLRDEEDQLTSLLLSPHSVDAELLAMQVALLRKGRVTEAGVVANRLLHRNLKDSELTARFAEWQAVRAQREQLLYAGARTLAANAYQARLKELQLKADALEYLLAAKLPGIRTAQPPSLEAIVPAVADRLQRDAVLIEVVRSRQFRPAKPPSERWGPAHYIALLLFPERHIAAHDLGEAASLDTEIRALRAALGTPNSNPIPAARALYERTLGPLQAALAGQTRLYLSLEGALQLVPFAALHDGKDYLLGRYHFHYLTSGRDLLREPSKRAPGPALVLGNPDFGKAASAGTVSPQAASVYERLSGLTPIPATQREAEQIAAFLGVQPLLGAAAKEEAIHEAVAPWIVHAATHGVFLTDIELPVVIPGTRSVIEFLAPRPKAVTPVLETEQLPGAVNAMNRSALLLSNFRAGATANGYKADGMLTAENARTLNFEGTQLVTLSACDTAQGATSIGQGVYGLRRAFIVAGAETVVMSLWQVHDAATGELMAAYYKKLLDEQRPGDRVKAMEEAMQELRMRAGREHPYYWAPFLVIGHDGPLRRPMRASGGH